MFTVFYVFTPLCKYVCLVQTIWSNSLCPLLSGDSLVSLSVMTDQCNIYVSNKSICILYGSIILSCAQWLYVCHKLQGDVCVVSISVHRALYLYLKTCSFHEIPWGSLFQAAIVAKNEWGFGVVICCTLLRPAGKFWEIKPSWSQTLAESVAQCSGFWEKLVSDLSHWSQISSQFIVKW